MAFELYTFLCLDSGKTYSVTLLLAMRMLSWGLERCIVADALQVVLTGRIPAQ